MLNPLRWFKRKPKVDDYYPGDTVKLVTNRSGRLVGRRFTEKEQRALLKRIQKKGHA